MRKKLIKQRKSKKVYCPDLSFICPKYPYRCCFCCNEQQLCLSRWKCRVSQSARNCWEVWAKTKEEMVWVRISRQAWENLSNEKHK